MHLREEKEERKKRERRRRKEKEEEEESVKKKDQKKDQKTDQKKNQIFCFLSSFKPLTSSFAAAGRCARRRAGSPCPGK